MGLRLMIIESIESNAYATELAWHVPVSLRFLYPFRHALLNLVQIK